MRRLLEAYRQSFSGLPRTAWTLATVSLVNRSGTMVLPFLVLYLTKERDFSAVEAGSVQGVYGLGSLAGAWLGGLLTDRIGARRIQIVSLVANGLGFFALGAARTHAAIFATAAVVSVVAEAFRPANAAALAEASPAHLTSRTFALNRMAVNMGMTLGMALGGVLARQGYWWLFAVDGITCLAAALLLVRRPSGSPASPHAKRASPAASPYRDRFFLVAWGFIVLLALVFFQLHGTFTLYLHDVYGLHEDTIGALLAINTVLVVVLEILIVHRLEKKEPLGIVAVGAFLVCLGFALLPYGRTPLWAAATIVVWTAGEITSFAFLATFVASRSAPGTQGRYMALYVMAFGLAYVLAPVVGTRVYESVGRDWVWHACGALGIVLLAGFGSMSVARRRGASHAAPASIAREVHDQ
jgi:predicted MFS family arabinose efflux permease